MTTEAERAILRALENNQDACIRALDANDMTAYRALTEQEARLMDEWRAVKANAQGR